MGIAEQFFEGYERGQAKKQRAEALELRRTEREEDLAREFNAQILQVVPTLQGRYTPESIKSFTDIMQRGGLTENTTAEAINALELIDQPVSREESGAFISEALGEDTEPTGDTLEDFHNRQDKYLKAQEKLLSQGRFDEAEQIGKLQKISKHTVANKMFMEADLALAKISKYQADAQQIRENLKQTKGDLSDVAEKEYSRLIEEQKMAFKEINNLREAMEKRLDRTYVEEDHSNIKLQYGKLIKDAETKMDAIQDKLDDWFDKHSGESDEDLDKKIRKAKGD